MSPLISSFTDYLVDLVAQTVDHALGRSSGRKKDQSFTVFVTNILFRAEITISVILTTLVYVDRARPHLDIKLEEWACERVFLGAIMLASKVCAQFVNSHNQYAQLRPF